MRVLITGGAGFIGAELGLSLLAKGHEVVAVDNLNDYYEVSLKEARLQRFAGKQNYRFEKMDITDEAAVKNLFANNEFDRVVHLAAQAGVRYSLDNPAAYINANLVGFGYLLEACRQHRIAHLLYASSSSVYGNRHEIPFREDDSVDNPVSIYAATKKANELMAHSYAHLYDLPCTGLRFFTVYGPWGRPDMAFFKFTKKMLAGESIPIFNHGELTRDFTYIDDIVGGMMKIIETPVNGRQGLLLPSSSQEQSNPSAPARVYNIGRGEKVQLMDYVRALENALGVTAIYDMLPMQPGDVEQTSADVSRLQADFAYAPSVGYEQGLQRFAQWYREYYDGKSAA